MFAKHPEEMNLVFDAVFNSGNVEAILSLYEPDARLVLHSGEEAVGRNAIRTIYQDWLALEGRMQSETLSCIHLADIALLRTNWSLISTELEARPVKLHGDAIEVIRRQSDGSWRYIIDYSGAC